MKKLPGVISEETLIPVSLMLSVIGMVYWLTNVASKADGAEKALVVYSAQMKMIDERLSRIEGKIDRDLGVGGGE